MRLRREARISAESAKSRCRLPPRDRLRVVVEVLPDLEQVLSATLPALDFWEDSDMQALAESQRDQRVDDFNAPLGGWPEDESVMISL